MISNIMGRVLLPIFFMNIRNNRMKNILAATVVATLFAGAAAAETQLAPNLSLETEVKAERKVDADSTILTVNPELTYGAAPALDFTLGTVLSVWDNTNEVTLDDEFDHLPVLSFGATYDFTESLSFEALTSYDLEAEERGEITVSASFKF